MSTLDSFVNANQNQIKIQLMAIIQYVKNVSQDGRVFAARNADCYSIFGFKNSSLLDCLVDIVLKPLYKAWSTSQ